MNRKLMLGIAAFLAVVGIALTGGENKVEAGFGGCGGGGLFAKHRAGGCGGGGRLLGGGGLFAKHRGGGCAGAEVAPEPCCPPAPAPAPSCGGAADSCSGGLFARLRAKHAAKKAARKCAAPDPCCEPACEPAPEPCCAPAPAPEPCCAPAPAPQPCCAPAPAAAPCCASAAPVMAAPVMTAPVATSTCCGGGEVMYGEPAVDGVVMEGVPTEAAAPAGAVMVNDAGEEIVPVPFKLSTTVRKLLSRHLMRFKQLTPLLM